jgi:NADH-quinone oxidoreductase subunit N
VRKAAAWDGGLAWLVVVAVANTIASLYYYLRWLAPAFAREPEPPADAVPTPTGVLLAPAVGSWASTTAVLAGTLALALGLAAGGLLAVLGGPLAR